MKKFKMMLLAVVLLVSVNVASADTFGDVGNEFTIDFVDISGDTNPTSGYGIVNNDYRISKFEITNDQFDKFAANSPRWTGAYIPSNKISWFEAAQFVNFLNTSTGNQPAYNFSDSTFSMWSSGDAGYDASNPSRNSNAKYFIPTEDEWVKAAYWNGTSLQTYATVGDMTPTQSGWNFYDGGPATDPYGPWSVGSGSEELNGTFDMMGNAWEWTESPYSYGGQTSDSIRILRGGSCGNGSFDLRSSSRAADINVQDEYNNVGFRVASVPAPVNIPIDIKPNSCPNPLNVRSRGKLPVAILGTENFDVNEVDVLSIRLAGVIPLRSNYKDVATPLVDAEECDCSTEGSDGYTDLTLKFDTQAIVATLGEVDDGDEFLLELTGELFDGTQIKGKDCIIVHAKSKPKPHPKPHPKPKHK